MSSWWCHRKTVLQFLLSSVLVDPQDWFAFLLPKKTLQLIILNIKIRPFWYFKVLAAIRLSQFITASSVNFDLLKFSIRHVIHKVVLTLDCNYPGNHVMTTKIVSQQILNICIYIHSKKVAMLFYMAIFIYLLYTRFFLEQLAAIGYISHSLNDFFILVEYQIIFLLLCIMYKDFNLKIPTRYHQIWHILSVYYSSKIIFLSFSCG